MEVSVNHLILESVPTALVPLTTLLTLILRGLMSLDRLVVLVVPTRLVMTEVSEKVLPVIRQVPVTVAVTPP